MFTTNELQRKITELKKAEDIRTDWGRTDWGRSNNCGQIGDGAIIVQLAAC